MAQLHSMLVTIQFGLEHPIVSTTLQQVGFGNISDQHIHIVNNFYLHVFKILIASGSIFLDCKKRVGSFWLNGSCHPAIPGTIGIKNAAPLG